MYIFLIIVVLLCCFCVLYLPVILCYGFSLALIAYRLFEDLDQLAAATVLQVGDEQKALGLNDPISLDCAPYVFEMIQNSRGTALFLDVSL